MSLGVFLGTWDRRTDRQTDISNVQWPMQRFCVTVQSWSLHAHSRPTAGAGADLLYSQPAYLVVLIPTLSSAADAWRHRTRPTRPRRCRRRKSRCTQAIKAVAQITLYTGCVVSVIATFSERISRESYNTMLKTNSAVWCMTTGPADLRRRN